MKTIEIKIYKFNELSEQAKQVAIKNYRENDVYTDHIYDDAGKTVKQFNELFNIKEGRSSWLDFSTSHIDDNIMNLKGLRLRTYIINNFGHKLFKGKYFSLWSKTEKSYKHYKDGYPVLKSRYSKVMFEHACVLTGVCYDESILQPVYEFLEWKLRPDYNSYMNFEALINDCFKNLQKDIDSEVDYQNSDEGIIEAIEAGEFDFTEEGEKY